MGSKKDNTKKEYKTVITLVRQCITMMKTCNQNTLTQMMGIQLSGKESGPDPDFETKKKCTVVTLPTKKKKTPKKKKTNVAHRKPATRTL